MYACLVSGNPFCQDCGVETDDYAKILASFGFKVNDNNVPQTRGQVAVVNTIEEAEPFLLYQDRVEAVASQCIELFGDKHCGQPFLGMQFFDRNHEPVDVFL